MRSPVSAGTSFWSAGNFPHQGNNLKALELLWRILLSKGIHQVSFCACDLILGSGKSGYLHCLTRIAGRNGIEPGCAVFRSFPISGHLIPTYLEEKWQNNAILRLVGIGERCLESEDNWMSISYFGKCHIENNGSRNSVDGCLGSFPRHTTKHLSSRTFVLNYVIFMFRSGGLGGGGVCRDNLN